MWISRNNEIVKYKDGFGVEECHTNIDINMNKIIGMEVSIWSEFWIIEFHSENKVFSWYFRNKNDRNNAYINIRNLISINWIVARRIK
jgi:hypothetical protein